MTHARILDAMELGLRLMAVTYILALGLVAIWTQGDTTIL